MILPRAPREGAACRHLDFGPAADLQNYKKISVCLSVRLLMPQIGLASPYYKPGEWLKALRERTLPLPQSCDVDAVKWFAGD